jgi:hypothetical protein
MLLPPDTSIISAVQAVEAGRFDSWTISFLAVSILAVLTMLLRLDGRNSENKSAD